MRGRRKQFDPVLAQWAERAERELTTWLRGQGYHVTEFPDGDKGVDHHAEGKFDKFNVEVERRSPRTWGHGDFPYDPIRVPERRGRYGKGTLLFTVRQDIRAGIVIFPQSLYNRQPIESANRYVSQGELFFHIPRREALPIDLDEESADPIPVANAKRIQCLLEHLDPVPDLRGKSWCMVNRFRGIINEKMNILGSEPPYGVMMDQWREWKDEAELRVSEWLFYFSEFRPMHSENDITKAGPCFCWGQLEFQENGHVIGCTNCKPLIAQDVARRYRTAVKNNGVWEWELK